MRHTQDFECCFRKGLIASTFVKAFVFHCMNKLKPIICLVHTKNICIQNLTFIVKVLKQSGLRKETKGSIQITS